MLERGPVSDVSGRAQGQTRVPSFDPYQLPISQFVLKVHERCNLACDYCYIYEMADQSWRDRPRKMSTATLAAAVSRIADHVRDHHLANVEIVLHGGEPLLAGIDFCIAATEASRTAMPDTQVRVGMQTNGVLLNDEVLEGCLANDIEIGVSLDGDEAANDRHRRFASGRSSHSRVVAALLRLTDDRYRRLFSGILCTIDIENDPVGTYEALLEFAPPAVDFLLPHGNWLDPPPSRSADPNSTPYGDWMIEVFDRWFDSPVQETRIRFFNEIIALLLGASSRLETIGTSPVGLAVIETDGSFEQVDTLKSTYSGAAVTGLNVFDHCVDDMLQLPSTRARRNGLDGLCDECRACPVVDVCGGGYYPHRFGPPNGFFNRSVYCPDLFKLIGHISKRVSSGLRVLVG